MRPLRRFIGSEIGQGLAARLAAFCIRLIYRTNRWQRAGYEIGYRLLAEDRRVIVCFWHGRLLMMPHAVIGARPFHILISDHRDGRLIARAVQRYGIGVIAGSSHRQPIQALLKVAQTCLAGGIVCITPDGPHGPRMRAAPGAVVAASLAAQELASPKRALPPWAGEYPAKATTIALLPVAYATSRRRLLASWDRFLLPLPFGRGIFVFGPEIEVAGGIDAQEREVLRLRLEEALNAVTAEADRLSGHPPVEPAPARALAPSRAGP